MGKRSSFERRERGYYPTPFEAVVPLSQFVQKGRTFIEPCAGDGRLVKHLESLGMKCLGAYDIEPLSDRVERKDAFSLTWDDVKEADCIITNPPWDRNVLHKLIEHFSNLKPTWLLFDADWMHTKQAIPFLTRCEKIVSVGRVKWFPESKMVGKDNCAWYLFVPYDVEETKFHGR